MTVLSRTMPVSPWEVVKGFEPPPRRREGGGGGLEKGLRRQSLKYKESPFT